jgi:dienelactone hydrolase
MTLLIRFLLLTLGGLIMALWPPVARAETFEARIAALGPHIEIHAPEGPGPHPVVVLMHGCGGRRAHQSRWAEAARAAGVAALVVDSYAHRGISRLEAYATVCLGLRLWGRERAGDLYAALEFARRQPWADPARLAAAGWSHGGWSVMDALALAPGDLMARATGLSGLPEAPLAGLKAVFLVYPYAGPSSLTARHGWRMAPQTLAVLGGRDVVVGVRTPRRVLEKLAYAGAPVEIIWFENATHAFDEPEACDVRVRFDAALTAEAEEAFRALLRRTLTPFAAPAG